MHNDKGAIIVLPNQMCFAGAADQMPVLKAVDTNIFTVMPISRGNNNKKENDMQENMTDDDSQKGGRGEHEGEVRESVKVDDELHEQAESLESILPNSKNISHPIKGTETSGGQVKSRILNGLIQ